LRGAPALAGDLGMRCSQLADAAARFDHGVPGRRWLSAAARALGEVAQPWELQVGAPSSERSYELLVRTARIEVWLIHWPCGGRLQLHDHGGASGAFRVVSGELRETYVDARCRLAQRRVGPGRGVAFGPGYVHDVENTEEQGATSIHVYAPPSDHMSFYRYEGPGQLTRVGSGPFEETDSGSEDSGRPAVAGAVNDRLLTGLGGVVGCRVSY
jgi:mannose-6-phosphate isomerase-like protein (cupin superfamily)